MKRAWALALACAACAKGPGPEPTPSGRSRLLLQTPDAEGLTSVDYTLRFWFLGQTPPPEYLTRRVTSVTPGDEPLLILACRGDGNGLNQVRADAVLHFAGAPDLAGSATAVFSCAPGADTPVNLVITVFTVGPGGYVDLGLGAAAVDCRSTVEQRGDGFLAVCGAASCGDPGAVFLFATSCRALDGSAPAFWACGAATDWTVLGPLASSAYVVGADGTFVFGIAALPQRKLAVPDPTLTDLAGNLLVWGAVATPEARLVREDGTTVSATLKSTRAATFAARLQAPGGPPLLLELDAGDGGTAAIAWTRFGMCNVPVAGTPWYEGLWALDVRLADAATATVIFASAPAGIATQRATCAADAHGVLACGSPVPL